MAVNPLAGLGLGIGWRPEIAGLAADLPGVRFTEVVAESLRHQGQLPPPLAQLRARGVTVVPHGTRLSLGGAEPLDPHRVRQFVSAAATLDAPLVSEHVAFVRAGGLEAGHLLPVPRSREALRVLARNVRTLRAELASNLDHVNKVLADGATRAACGAVRAARGAVKTARGAAGARLTRPLLLGTCTIPAVVGSLGVAITA